MKRTFNILYLEDDLAFAKSVMRMLKRSKGSTFKTHHVRQLSEGIAQLGKKVFDLVLLEPNLPDSKGLSTFNRIRRYISNAPIVLLTSNDDIKLALQTVKAGAQDYLIIKDINSNILIRALLYAIERQDHRAELSKLSLVASKTSNAVIITDKEGRIDWVNEGFGRMNGYILKEVKGTRGEILRKGSALKKSDQARLEECKRTRKTFNYEIVNYKKNGEKYWVQTSVTPVFNKRNEFNYFIIVETDITERVKFASELQKAKKTAEKAKQSEERFLANMSHEIRTPLNAISGMAEMLYKTKLNQSQYNYVNTISTSSGILVSIIGDILDISKIKSSKIEFEKISFSAYGLIYDVIDIIKPDAIAKSIDLKAEIDSEFSNNIIGDPLRLKQIFLNLVGNAAKFTDSGSITIYAKVLKQSKSAIEAEFSVTDTGIGIAKKNLSLIFNSFQQAQSSTERKYGGTGLGLAIVKSLVQLQGGNIRVESEENKGTSFIFTLSFKKDNTTYERYVSKTEAIASLKEIKFLLVEDNEMNQFYIKELFKEKWGVKIDCADDGEIAIDKVTNNTYDIILMDVQMPNMDGYQATRYIRKKLPPRKRNIPILGITANASVQDRKNCLKAGMNEYLTKPIQENELYSKICILLSID